MSAFLTSPESTPDTTPRSSFVGSHPLLLNQTIKHQQRFWTGAADHRFRNRLPHFSTFSRSSTNTCRCDHPMPATDSVRCLWHRLDFVSPMKLFGRTFFASRFSIPGGFEIKNNVTNMRPSLSKIILDATVERDIATELPSWRAIERRLSRCEVSRWSFAML